jgi:hypothetical protein
VHGAALQEDVYNAGDDQADQAHDKERANTRQVALGGVAVEAHPGEHRRRDEKHPGNRRAGIDEEDICE